MEILPLIGLGGLLAGYREQILMGDDLDLVGTIASRSDRDAIAIVAVLFEIEGREAVVGVAASLGFQHVEQPVEADRRAAIGGQIGSPHNQILLRAIWT